MAANTGKSTQTERSCYRKYELSKRYGLGLDAYDALLQSQKGVCKICGGTNKLNRLSVDHDHVTGRIRGLLCIKCNLGIGNFKDSKELLLKAVEYLN